MYEIKIDGEVKNSYGRSANLNYTLCDKDEYSFQKNTLITVNDKFKESRQIYINNKEIVIIKFDFS